MKTAPSPAGGAVCTDHYSAQNVCMQGPYDSNRYKTI